MAVSALYVPLYKAFPHLFGTFDTRNSITFTESFAFPRIAQV